MISLANIDLRHHAPDLLARVRQYLDPRAVWDWCATGGAPHRLRHLGWRDWRPAEVRPGVLVWPASSACRWAHGHYVASREVMERVVQAATAADATGGMLPLVVGDGTRSVEAPVWLLPPRPLYDVPGAGGTFLLTVVDDRWRWWWQACDVRVRGATGGEEGEATWAGLFAAIGEALGVEIEVDPAGVGSAFLAPAVDLSGRYESLPVLLDAAAASCGTRMVFDVDGAVRVLGAVASRRREDANLLLAPRLAGGETYRG